MGKRNPRHEHRKQNQQKRAHTAFEQAGPEGLREAGALKVDRLQQVHGHAPVEDFAGDGGLGIPGQHGVREEGDHEIGFHLLPGVASNIAPAAVNTLP
ncbi:hypothetical protein D3C73_1176110 [compost metagenome]